MHTQSVIDWLPADDCELDGQLVHADDPVDVVYVPAAQGVHADDPVDVVYVPAAQGVQPTSWFQSELPYVPAAQS